MGSITPILRDFFQPELESRLASFDEGRRTPLINRMDKKAFYYPGDDYYALTNVLRHHSKPTMRSVMQGFSPTDLIEVMTPYSDDPVRLWEEGFDWDEWGSYADTQQQAEIVGGIPFTIHDGDDGDRDYIRVPLGRVNRWGAHIMTKDSYDRLLAWSQLASPFNEYDDGQVITQFLDKGKMVQVGRHRIIPLTVQGGELVHDY